MATFRGLKAVRPTASAIQTRRANPCAATAPFRIIDISLFDRRRYWLAFGGAWIVNALLTLGVILLGMLPAPWPLKAATPKGRLLAQIALNTPPPDPKAVLRPSLPKPVLPPRLPLEVLRTPSPPASPDPSVKLDPPTPPPSKVQPEAPTDPPAASPPAPTNVARNREIPTVRTGVFGESALKATVDRPVRDVQTGGFGSPNGFAGEAMGGHPCNVAKLGSFDLPAGPGYGNGSGGTHGVRGVVSTADFDNTMVAGAEGGRGDPSGSGHGEVRSSGFIDVQAVVPAPANRGEPITPSLEPLEILSKPNPMYTEEARKLNVEGEVLLEVVFEASGKVRVVRVLQGLGHGLDEAALRTAAQIRFKPARRDGQPVDFAATLRIVFQLAG